MRLGALGAVGVAAAVTVALVVGNSAGGPGHSRPGPVNTIGPIALSATDLKARATTLDQAMYWVGPEQGYTYELTRTVTGNVFVRYLPPGVSAGTHQGEYLVIATYPYRGAFASVKALDGGHPLPVAGGQGGIATVERGKPTNYRVAFPHVDYQIEVYAPSAAWARRAATSAALVPVP